MIRIRDRGMRDELSKRFHYSLDWRALKRVRETRSPETDTDPVYAVAIARLVPASQVTGVALGVIR